MNPLHKSRIEPKRPFYLFEDVPEHVVKVLSPLVPEYACVTSADDVHETDFDAVVSFAEEPTNRREGLPILSFGAKYLKLRRTSSTGLGGTFIMSVSHHGPRSRIVDFGDSGGADHLHDLVRETIPAVFKEPTEVWDVKLAKNQIPYLLPLLTRGEEKFPHAFIAPRVVHDEEVAAPIVMALPADTKRPDSWLREFQSILHRNNPQTFPLIDDWRTNDPRWLPITAEDLLELKRHTELELRQTITKLESEIEETESRLNRILVSEEDTGLQRLLTAKGDGLVEAVKEVLEVLGYEVEDMDSKKKPHEPKLEDLRLALPGNDDWIVLAEVKGYKNDAKVSDLGQLAGRPLRKFVAETGGVPSGLWHIINTRISENPSSRRRAHHHFNDEDTATISAHDGRILETRDLFQAAKAIQRGDCKAEEVRAAIESSRLYWTADSGLTKCGYQK